MAERQPDVEPGAWNAEPGLARILVFFDYACPFCYLDWPRFKRLRDEYDALLVLVPFELRPMMPAEGLPLGEVAAPHTEHVREYMVRMAVEGGLAFAEQVHVPNTHLALTLGELARDVDPDAHERVHEAVFSAYFGEGRDIGDRDVLLGIAQAQGMDLEEVRQAFDERVYDKRLDDFAALAIYLGVTATPSALVCTELYIGTRPFSVLAEAVERCLEGEGAVEELVAEESEEETLATPAARSGEPSAR